MSDAPRPFKDHFSGHSADYAAYRPTYPPELAAYLAGLAPARDLALDCGCGSGQLSVLLAAHFDRVVAIDPSAAQIAAANSHARVEYRVAPAEATGLASGSADLVTAAQAAHWFDMAAFNVEARRVLRPGGVIALIAYKGARIDAAIDGAVAPFYREVLDPFWPLERRHVESDYRTLPFPFAEIVAPAFEMRAEWSLSELAGYIETWSAAKALERKYGRAPIERFRADLAAAWGDGATRRTIRWPLALRIGRV